MNASMNIENVLEEKGVFVSITVGVSMYPMLRNRKDTIVIKPVHGRLKKYDVPLYRRGSDYVLHRIMKVTSYGYVICGDNCLNKEYQVTDDDIVGVLSGFFRGNKKVDMSGLTYRIYCRVWVACYPVRCVVKRCWWMMKRVVKKCISK